MNEPGLRGEALDVVRLATHDDRCGRRVDELRRSIGLRMGELGRRRGPLTAHGGLEWLAGGGEMGVLIRGLDWSRSPLGPIASWPQSLRTTVSLCLASNFPINIIWGSGHTQIYNDGYRVVCGAVHPRALGEDYRVTWASAWPAVGEPFARALAGQTSYLENQRMFLERNGYAEETFFTFSLSPIRDESGHVVGLFHPVTETTATMLAQRRTRALRDIADGAGRATQLDAACELLIETLEKYVFDIPFAALYLTSGDGGGATLRGVFGVEHGSPLAPDRVASQAASGSWPFSEAAASGRALRVADVRARFGDVAARVYPESIATAFVLPLHVAGVERPLGYLVAGASPRLPCDEAYLAYFEMLRGAASAALGNARGYELERQRAEALAEVDRAKTAFFSNVSHEFRTPLTLMLGPLEDVLAGRMGPIADGAGDELKTVYRNALRLLKLVNALLDFSRIEAGRLQASLRPMDVGRLTRDVASAFHSAVEQAGMKLVVEVEPELPLVPVDPDMWETIVLNLVSNAFKFTRAGEIRVGLRRAGTCLELQVRDTGIGIPANELHRVFERFHRIQGAHGRTHEGTGIGLALVHDLARLHGGSVDVESVEGQGTAFSVQIPLTQPDRATFASEPPASLQTRGTKRAAAFVAEATRWLPPNENGPIGAGELPPSLKDAEGGSPSGAGRVRGSPSEVERVGVALSRRVVLADDNADMRDYIRRLLVGRGYRVTPVTNGAEALRTIEAERPDLVLSDFMMPVMDGGELVKRLRAHPALCATPVILVSARAGEDETASGLELGADDYLVKPFSAKELLARVDSQMAMVALRKRVAEQEARAAEREAMASELRRGIELRDVFLSIASHELRTPLTALQLQVQGLQRQVSRPGAGVEKLSARLVMIERQVERMARLVSEMLEVSRVVAGRLELERQDVDLVRVASEVCQRLHDQLAAAGCSLVTALEGSLVGRWDRVLVDQIVTNLLTNALKYGRGAPVEVAATRRDDHAVLSVRDRGIGIAAEDQDRIFERFGRAVSSDNYGGFGLGLWIVKVFAEALGGVVTVESVPGRGACFEVDLPMVPASALGDTSMNKDGVTKDGAAS